MMKGCDSEEEQAMNRRRVFVAAAVLGVLLMSCSSSGGSGFGKFTADDGVRALQKAGVELGDMHPMTKQDYGIAPMVATSAVRFTIPSLGPDKGGRIMAFASQGDLDRTKTYYDDLHKASAALFSWTFVKANVLVQINGDLPEAQARTYEAALARLGT